MPTEPQLNSSYRTVLYNISRYRLGSLPLSRWLVILLIFCLLLFVTGSLPGRWLGVGLCSIAIMVWLFTLHYLSQQDFIIFAPSAAPDSLSSPLAPTAQIPLYVTGHFSVEGKYQRFTWLPGTFRTFAIREHAILCQVRARRFLAVAQWPKEQVGMWYIFIKPEEITGIRWGALQFGRDAYPAIEIQYQMEIPKLGWFRPARILQERAYLAFLNEEDQQLVGIDLLYSLS